MQLLHARPGRVLSSIVFTVLLAGLPGCHSKSAATPENFITGLNRYYTDHPECLFTPAPRFPYETGNAAELKQMNALVDMKMLDVHSESTLRVSRYTPTTIGSRYAPRFCYGHRVVSAIDHFTPPAPANGFTETTVTYRYTLEDVPVWAKSQEVRAAFPAVAHALAGESTGTATLAGTIAGWQVPE